MLTLCDAAMLAEGLALPDTVTDADGEGLKVEVVEADALREAAAEVLAELEGVCDSEAVLLPVSEAVLLAVRVTDAEGDSVPEGLAVVLADALVEILEEGDAEGDGVVLAVGLGGTGATKLLERTNNEARLYGAVSEALL